MFNMYVSVPDGVDKYTQKVIRENINALGITVWLN